MPGETDNFADVCSSANINHQTAIQHPLHFLNGSADPDASASFDELLVIVKGMPLVDHFI